MPLGIRILDLPSSDNIRKPDKTLVETVTVGATSVASLTVQPGWVWSECIAPVVGKESCQAHITSVLSNSSS